MNASGNSNSNSTNLPIATYLYCLIPVKLLIGVINYIFNGYIIHLVVFKIKKKTYSNVLFLFNAIADFTSGLISIPAMTLFTTIGYWPLGKVTCVIWVINDFAVTSISAFSLLLIAVHRYLQIKRPVETTEKMTKNKWLSIAFQWIIIYAFWTISVIIISSPPEFEVESCYFTSSFPYVLTADLIYYIFPVLGVFVINTLVFIELLKKKNNHHKITGTVNLHIETNKRLEQRDFKALVCLYVVAGLLIFFFAIFFVTWPLKAFGSDLVSDLLLEVGYWICYAYSSVNPIILLIFHEKFNKEFKMSIFKKVFPTSSNSQTRH